MSQNNNDRETDRDRSFLSRWSQRKHEAKQPESDGVPTPADEDLNPPPVAAEAVADEEFDLSSLPKLEDLTEGTDITGFLRKGVPESVRNAALRKSWALDPAIRNYVNPALDYAYDWNTPGGVPGNSELAVGTDIARMVLQIMGSGAGPEAVEPEPDGIAPLHQNDAPDPAEGPNELVAMQQVAADPACQPVRLSAPDGAPMPLLKDSAASTSWPNDDTRQEFLKEPRAMQQPLRRHGSAIPKV